MCVMVGYEKPKILYVGDIKDPITVERIDALRGRFDIEVCNGTETSFIESFHIYDGEYDMTIFSTEESYIAFTRVCASLNVPGLDIPKSSGVKLFVLNELNLDEKAMSEMPEEPKSVFSKSAEGLSTVVGKLCTGKKVVRA